MSENIQETVIASVNYTARGENPEEESKDSAKAYYASQFDEYPRICAMFKFVCKKDEPDESVCSILRNMLENPPTKENTDFAHTDIRTWRCRYHRLSRCLCLLSSSERHQCFA